jgi:hypothetical protein
MASTENNNAFPGKEPDVILVIGGEEFHEYSHVLQSWSDYFYGCFRQTKMQETNRFNFPHRDPQEWAVIKELTCVFSDTTINKDNVGVAVSWFDELCCTKGLEKCDHVISGEIRSISEHFTMTALKTIVDGRIDACMDDGETLLHASVLALNGNLHQSMALSLSILQSLLVENPIYFFGKIGTLVWLMQESQEHREKLWPGVQPYLVFFNGDPTDELLANELLPDMIAQGMIAHVKKEYHEKFSDRVFRALAEHGGVQNPIVKELVKDADFGDVFRLSIG